MGSGECEEKIKRTAFFVYFSSLCSNEYKQVLELFFFFSFCFLNKQLKCCAIAYSISKSEHVKAIKKNFDFVLIEFCFAFCLFQSIEKLLFFVSS